MFLTMIAFVAIILTISILYLDAPQNLTIRNLGPLFNLQAFVYFNLYLTFTAILACLPFGGTKVPRQSYIPNQQKYDVLTGGLSLISCFFVLFLLEILGIRVIEYVSKNMFHLTISGMLSGFLITVYIHLRSYLTVPENLLFPKAIGKNGIQSFFLGREIRPRFLNVLDLKIYFNRIAILTMVGLIKGCPVLNRNPIILSLFISAR